MNKYPAFANETDLSNYDIDKQRTFGNNYVNHPVVVVGNVFGLGDWGLAYSVACAEDDCDCEYNINDECFVHSRLCDEISPSLSYFAYLKHTVAPLRDILNDLKLCSNENDLKNIIKRLNKFLGSNNVDYWRLKVFGGLCWGNDEECEHVIELMSLYFRIHISDGAFVIHDESPDDYKLFAHGINDEIEDNLNIHGINLVILEFIYKWQSITHEKQIPLWLIEKIIQQ